MKLATYKDGSRDGQLVVVSRDVLLRMKHLAGRPQDLADIEKLEAIDGE